MNVIRQPFDDDDLGPRQRPARGRATRHRLTVLAADAADAVRSAGGLIFDRVSSGWEVQVYLAACADNRALRILGTDALDLSGGFDSAAEWPDAIIVSADLYRRDIRVRNHFGAASLRHRTEVALWGGEWPARLEAGIGRVEHRLSRAAQVFKAHAMEAAGLAPEVTDAESFRSGKRRFAIAAPMLPPS